MNAILFMSLEKHQIYLVNENDFSFFIAIPSKEFNKTNISIEFRSDYINLNVNNNNLESVKLLIKDIYTKIDNYNISLVIPITENDELNEIKTNDNDFIYEKLDNIVGRIINMAYFILSQNKIEVDSKIIIINNEKYKNFINWFLNKYQGRCDYKSFLELMAITSDDTISLNKIEMTDINFVVGKKDDHKVPKEESHNLEVNEDIIIDEIDLPTNYAKRNEQTQLGYVSYCLLGIMSVIISLVLLYILL